MRSYSRKRPDNQLIENVHELCRLCLTKADDVRPIFTEGSDNICATLALRIMICVGLEMTREECLPNIICTKCFKELDKCYTFRKKCEVTYQKLKSHAMAVKQKQNKVKVEKEVEKKVVPIADLENMVVTFDNDQFSEVNELNLNGVAQANHFVETLSVMKTEDRGEIRILEDKTIQQPLSTNVATAMIPQDSIEIRIPGDNNTMEQTLADNSTTMITDDGIEIRIPEVNKIEQTLPILAPEDSIEIRIPEDNNAMEQEPEQIDPLDLDVTTFLSSMLIELGVLTQHEGGLLHANQNVRTLELETGDGSQLTLEIVEEDAEEPDDILNEDVELLAEDVSPAIAVPAEESEAATDTEIVIKYIESNSRVSSKFATDGKRGIVCEECGKVFASRSALTRHSRVHSGERPFACKLCARRFAQREVMLRHMLVHEARRPHACSQCSKSFTQRAALALHARRHAPAHARALALHRCDRCPKVFLHASGLSRHIMMHNGRVFMCGACERQFKDKSSLLRHLKNTNHKQLLIDNPDT